MTTVVVLAEPPAAGDPLPELAGTLTTEQRESLYRAMLADVCGALQHGEADLVVNYPPEERVPDGVDPETAVRDVIGPAVGAPDDVRYEVQVGETRAGRIGNAVTHLLETENEPTAGFVEPTAPFLRRQHVGNAAMSLRSSEVVLGPSTDGRVYFGAFQEPIDFEDAFVSPAVETLTERAIGAGYDVDFLPMLPRVEAERDLATAVPLLRSRVQAERIAPVQTAEWVAEHRPTVDSDNT
jgi:2-phospho-L-lactate guanylyltransferase (CobY/MobA/RfbA family)